MQSVARRRIEMAVRAREFMRAHPFTEASAQALVAKLEERLSRAESLASLAFGASVAALGATTRRQSTRSSLHQSLRHLVRVVDSAKGSHPQLLERFRRPRAHPTDLEIATAAKTMLKEAEAEKELLVSLGMTESMLQELTRSLAEFEESKATAISHRHARIGAHGRTSRASQRS